MQRLTEPDPMLFFGSRDWTQGRTTINRPPPTTLCADCEEPIGPLDSGVIMAHVTVDGAPAAFARHRECFLRSVVGSVGHQQGRCTCYGGTEDDPPGLTRREAARQAVELALGAPKPEE